MAKTHTKINQLAGETLKGFAYANNTDKELVDDVLATRDPVTKETEIAREYDVIKDVQNVTYTGTGIDNINIINLVGNSTYTVTVDSPLQTIRSLNPSAWIDNDCFFGNYSPSDSVFSVSVDPGIGHISTPEPVISGTFTQGEYITGNLGSTGNFISYNGTDFVYASISPFIVGEVITGTSSGASITISGTQTSTGKETFTWSENSRDLQTILSSGVLICETTPQTIGLVNTCEVTFGFTSGHDTNGEYRFFHGTGNILFQTNSFTGTISDGEVVTGLTSGATAKAWSRYYGPDFVYLIPVSGAFVPGETISGASGSFQTTNITYITDTLSITDGVTTDVNVPIILQTSGNSEQISFDGGNLQFNFANDFPAQQPWRVVGDNWVIFNSQTVTTITTGYESNPVTFPGVPFPINVSAMVSTDGTDKMAVGVLDLSPLGSTPLASGTIAIYGDGSQSTFTMQKGSSNINIINSSNGSSLNIDMTTGSSYSINGFDGSNNYGLSIGPNQFVYSTNGVQTFLPNTYGNPGDVATTDGAGTVTWQPAGGSITGNQYDVVVSNGAGGTQQSSSFKWDYSGNIPTILSTQGIYYDPSTRFAFLGDNNNVNNNTYVRVSDQTGEIILNTPSFGITSIGNVAQSSTRIVVNPGTGVIDDYVQNGLNIRDLFGNDIMRVSMSNQSVAVGDMNNTTTMFQSIVDAGSQIQRTTSAGFRHFELNSGFGFYGLGDIDNQVTGDCITIDRTINTTTLTSQNIQLTSIPSYADDADAGANGLPTDRIYQTNGTGAAPLNVAGILMIKQ